MWMLKIGIKKRSIILMCQINILKKDNHNIIPKRLSDIILAIDIIVSLKQHVLVFILLLRFLQDNRVIYEFYDHDPYDKAANNAKALKDKIENDYNFKIQSIGVIYFSDGSVNIIEGSDESDKYVDTVSTPISLEKVIEDAIDLSKHPLTDKQIEEISESFKQHMNN